MRKCECWNNGALCITGQLYGFGGTYDAMHAVVEQDNGFLTVWPINGVKVLLDAPKEPAAKGGVPEITDDQMIGVLHSFGIDTKLSVYGFDALQVAGTNVPGIKGIVRMCLACIQSGVWPAPRYSFDTDGNLVRIAAPTGDHP